MKRMNYAWLTIMATSLAFASCQEEDTTTAEANKNYENSWKENIGDIDPNHNWNTASIGNVTASTSGREGNYTLKLYTSNPRSTTKQAYLLAKYDVRGGETIDYQFDMPASLKYVYAALVDNKGYRMVKSAQLMNGKVNFDFSTGGKARTTSDDGIVTYEQTKDSDGNILYYYFNAVDYNTPLTQLPEKKTYYPEKGLPNSTILHRSFLYESTGVPFTIYPFYNITNNAGFELGIYYYTNSGRKEIKLWNRTNAQYYQYKNYETDSEKMWTILGNMQDTPQALEYADKYEIPNRTYDSETEPKGSPLRIPGITINIPQGIQFGFYITNNYGDQTKLYSEASLNPTRYLNGQQNEYFSNNFAATYHKHSDNGKCEFYLTFEDGVDFDYNDLIVRIGDAPNTLGEVPPLENHENVLLVVDREEEKDVNMSYIVAYEDLGANDFDFNDVVLGIEYVSTNQADKKATFKLMAAGGTLPVSVAYNTTKLWEEIHQAFGVASNTPVNVKGNTTEKEHISQEIAVEDNFTILADASKLKITVTKHDGNKIEEISVPNPDATGKTPQAILVASPTWEWPREGQPIVSHPQYGEDFKTWVTNNTFTKWWDHNYTWSSDEEENPGEGGGEGGETPNYGTPIYSSTETIENGCTFNGNNLSIPNAIFDTYKETGCTLTFIANEDDTYIKIYVGGESSDGWIEILNNIDNSKTIPFIVNITTEQMEQFEKLYPNQDKIIQIQDGAKSITEIYIK